MCLSRIRESLPRALGNALPGRRHEEPIRTARRTHARRRVCTPERRTLSHTLPTLRVAECPWRALGHALTVLRVKARWTRIKGERAVENQ